METRKQGISYRSNTTNNNTKNASFSDVSIMSISPQNLSDSNSINEHDNNDKEDSNKYRWKHHRRRHRRTSYKVLLHPYRIMAYIRNWIWRCRLFLLQQSKKRFNGLLMGGNTSTSISTSTNTSTNTSKAFLTSVMFLAILFFFFFSTSRRLESKNGTRSPYPSKYYSTHKRSLVMDRSNYIAPPSKILTWIPRFQQDSITITPFQYNEWGNDLKILKPDYGDLKLTFVEHNRITHHDDRNMLNDTPPSFTRYIQPDPERHHGHVWTEEEYESDAKYFDTYYAFDDDYVRNTQFLERHQHCRRTAFHKLYYPNCNLFHELPMQHGTLLGEGAYREAYLLQERYDPEIVVKLNRFHGNPFEYDRYEFIRMDALVMERLSASPRIVDMYGHCATSVNTEFLPDEVDPFIIPGDGDGDHLQDHDDVDPQNDLTITEKLDYALQMAEAIADLHGYKEGVLVHDDIQTLQFLFAPDGRIKLNDFNRAEAMLFDEEAGVYCKYQNGAGGGDFRAPEEYVDGPLNEKIDNFSYGNILYGLMTGLWNFYEEEKVQKKIEKIKAGKTPYIDPRYRNRNYIQDRLIYVMEQCWKFDPEKRADIFWVVKFLRETKEEATKMGFYKKEFIDLHFQDWPVVSVKDQS